MATPVVPSTNPAANDPPTVVTPGTTTQTTPAAITPSSAAAAEPTTSQTTAAPPVQSSAAPSSAADTSTAAVVTSSSAAPSSTSTTSVAPSSAAPSSSSTTPTSSAAPTTTSTTPTSTAGQSTQIVTVTRSNQSAPGLITDASGIARTSTSATAAKETGSANKGGIGGSGLSVGALVGIIVGALAVLAIIGLLVTRSMRKRARAKRSANRSSMFEPWPAPVAMEDEPYEKPAYDAPAQSYPMHNASSDVYADSAYPATYDGAYPSYNEYPPQGQYGQQQYSGQAGAPYSDMDMGAGMAGAGAGAAGAAGLGAVGATVGESAAAASGIHDGMMVRVKVAFVRSLEDELAITPGQQLYLHTAYDDGWTLCEDQAQNRGVVPYSCLEPWDETADLSQAPGPADQSLSADVTTQRRSSLYAPQ